MDQMASHIVTPEQPAEPRRALGFPLLIAALPEIVQFSMPKVPAAENTSPSRVQMPIQEPTNVASMTTKAAANSIRPKPKAPSQVFQPRYEPVRPTSRQHLTASSANGRTATNLATVFNGLQTENSSRGERAEAKSDLQEMFSRL